MSSTSPKDEEVSSPIPNGVPLAPGTQRAYVRVYAAGRIDLAADGPPEYTSVVKDSLRWAATVQIMMTPDRFLETLLARGVPPEIANRVVASAFLLDDQTYLSSRPGW